MLPIFLWFSLEFSDFTMPNANQKCTEPNLSHMVAWQAGACVWQLRKLRALSRHHASARARRSRKLRILYRPVVRSGDGRVGGRLQLYGLSYAYSRRTQKSTLTLEAYCIVYAQPYGRSFSGFPSSPRVGTLSNSDASNGKVVKRTSALHFTAADGTVGDGLRLVRTSK